MQITFIFMLIEVYQIKFATLLHLKNQRRPVLAMEMKHEALRGAYSFGIIICHPSPCRAVQGLPL